MRVVFNSLSSFRRRTGVGSYAAHLAMALRQTVGNGVTVFPDGWMALAARLAGRAMSTSPAGVVGASPSLGSRMRRFVRTGLQDLCEREFRRACREGGHDLYHEPNFIPWNCDLPTAVTIHDLSVVLHPEWHPLDRVAFHEEWFAATLSGCRHILTVSETMRREIIDHCGISPHRVTAVHNGVRADLRPMTSHEAAPTLRRFCLPRGFLLYVGTIEPRKNILTLLRAYCALDARLRERHPLVLAGPWGWKFEQERAFFESEARRRGVIHLGYVSDDQLNALYSSASALVYPSRYEGFGLPPAEMMACGGAVLASTAPAVREVCGEHAEFIDPDDVLGWRDAMLRVLSDREWRRKLREGVIQHAGQFTWRRCAEQTWAAYESMVAPSRELQAA